MTLSLLLATRNPAKAEQIRGIVRGLAVDVVDGTTLEGDLTVDEHGASHLAIAVAKAAGWSRMHSATAIASDGGVSIPALGPDWMSLVTRRATGGDVSDEEHAARLLRRMRDIEGDRRAAYWTEAIAVARGGGLIGAWEASGLHGRIASHYVPDPRGTPGFWLGSIWESVLGARLWELSDEESGRKSDPWETFTAPVRELIERLAG